VSAGKGDRPRPLSISKEEFDRRWPFPHVTPCTAGGEWVTDQLPPPRPDNATRGAWLKTNVETRFDRG
jgi:hypothetical protein